MRELMFRIWDNDKNEWLAESDDNALTYYGFHLIGEVMTVQSPRKWTVNGVVEQYTGLKDKNGKEIYEGDIVKCGPYSARPIVFEKGRYWLGETLEDLFVADRRYDVEIIGNIHENPELLEAK